MLAPCEGDWVLSEIRSSTGIAVLGGQVVIHGRDLHHECLDLSFVRYLLFCVCGREFTDGQARVLEQFWVATGYPDARLWCNRIAAYLGSARVDPGLAMSAALAATNSLAYGFRALRNAYDVQSSVPEPIALREPWLQRQLSGRRRLYGYGRPIIGHDERIPFALQSMLQASVPAGPALGRAFWLHDRLKVEKKIEMNITALWAAVAIDFGIRRHEFEQFNTLMFAPGYAAAYGDQRARPPMAFLAGHQTR
jgi:citrate synthase